MDRPRPSSPIWANGSRRVGQTHFQVCLGFMFHQRQTSANNVYRHCVQQRSAGRISVDLTPIPIFGAGIPFF